MNSDIPDSNISYSWFDDVGLIEWDTLELISGYPISIPHPNDYDYIQLFHDQEQINMFGMELENSILGSLDPLNAEPRAAQNIIRVPDYFHFYDESKGPVGERNWILDSELIGVGKTPSLFCEEPGIYEITLKISGLEGQEDQETISVVALAPGSDQHELGDVNGDGSVTMVDALLCANHILGLFVFQPVEFLAADIDGNGLINIFDVLSISDLVDQ
jgi:hypothetical protein